MVAAAAAVARGAAAGAAVGVGGTGGLVGREGGGAGARRVGCFMWLLVLQDPRDALCLNMRDFSPANEVNTICALGLQKDYDAHMVQIESNMCEFMHRRLQADATD